ncbi:MAG: hypothetical protein EBT38_06215, partial [Acidimicrobiia bacterium]|nr:hypothetical protein [Acidimicrobiia bacterium]
NYIRENFFGPDPRLREMVSHLTDSDLQALPRGGHDYRKVYAAFKAASDNLGSGRPTAILCKTVKGWTLGPEIEGRNATHQIKKMNVEQLRVLRDRLHLNDEISDAMLEGDVAPYYRPSEDSVEYQYLVERRRALGGFVPKRVTTARRPLSLPSDDAFREFDTGSNNQAVSTTMGFTRLLRNLARDKSFGERVVPIIPDEARTFGMDSLFRELKIYASQGHRSGQPRQFHRRRHVVLHTRSTDGAVLHLLFDVRFPASGRPHLAGSRCAHAWFLARCHGWAHHPARRRPATPRRPLACLGEHRSAVPCIRPCVCL